MKNDFKIGDFIGNYEIVSEAYKLWGTIGYKCRCCKCKKIRQVEQRSLHSGQQCRCLRKKDPELRKKQIAEYKKEWFERNKEHVYSQRKGNYKSKWALRYLYHISKDEYEAFLEKQDFKCCICERLHDPTVSRGKGKLHVDHNHETGKIRGLLCHNCNVVLGLCHEDTYVLAKAISYLIGEKK